MPGRFRLPVDHKPAMRVPKGGSSCLNCRFYKSHGGEYGQCMEPNFAAFYETRLIPCPPAEFCSDWYMPNQRLPNC
jgi:hypothetical protein